MGRRAAGEPERPEHEHHALAAGSGPIEQQPADRTDRKSNGERCEYQHPDVTAGDRGQHRAAGQRDRQHVIKVGHAGAHSGGRLGIRIRGSRRRRRRTQPERERKREKRRLDGHAGPLNEVDGRAGHRADRDETFETGRGKESRGRTQLTAERDAHEHAQYREPDRDEQIQIGEGLNRQEAERAGTKERADRKKNNGRRRRGRQAKGRSRSQQREEPGRRAGSADSPIQRIGAAELPAADISRRTNH
jgi:hypothetical protein